MRKLIVSTQPERDPLKPRILRLTLECGHTTKTSMTSEKRVSAFCYRCSTTKNSKP